MCAKLTHSNIIYNIIFIKYILNYLNINIFFMEHVFSYQIQKRTFQQNL